MKRCYGSNSIVISRIRCDAVETPGQYTKNDKYFSWASFKQERYPIAGIVLTFPVLAGKVESWRRFCQELYGSRRKPYEASRLRLGITRERLTLVETAFGSMAETTLEALDIDRALGQIIASSHPFDIWYREKLQELHGINLAVYEQFVQTSPPLQIQAVFFEWFLKSDIGGKTHRQ